MLPEDYLKENHKNYRNNYIVWKITSEDLLISAEFLCKIRFSKKDEVLLIGEVVPDAFRIINSELLLRGSLLECLLKALYLKKELGKLVGENGYQKINGVGEHNLLELADKLNLKFTDEERFCNKKTFFVY